MDGVWSLIAPWLGRVADVLSIIGFGITVWVALAVRKIRAEQMAAVRTPQLLERLDRLLSELSDHLNDYRQRREQVKTVVLQMGATLRALEGKVAQEPRGAVKNTRRLIRQYEAGHTGESAAWEIYRETQRVVMVVRDQLEDQRWLSR